MRDHVRVYLAVASKAVGRGRLALLFAIQLGAAAAEAGTLVLLLPVMQLLVGAEAGTLPVIDRTVDPATALVLLAAVVVVRAVLQWAASVMTAGIRLQTMDQLRIGALRDLFAAAWPFIAAQRRSHLVQALTTEVMRAGAAIEFILRSAVALLLLLATAGAMIIISPLAGGLALGSGAALALIAYPTLRSSTRLGEAHSDRIAAFGALVADSLHSIRLIKAHEAGDRWTAVIEDEAQAGRHVQLRHERVTAGVRAGLSLLAVGAALSLVLLGREAGLAAPELLVLAVTALRLLTGVQSFVGLAQTINHLAPAIDRVRTLAADAAAHRDAELIAPLAGPRADELDGEAPLVELRDISVAYGEDPVIEGLSVTIARESLTVITGPSGAGKSTLLDVLLGLLSPTTGERLVDGTPLRDLRSWRARIGYVPQETVLVPGTVWDNLVWSAGREITREDAWSALETACVADVVRRLPEGLETDLQDLTRLSGGEQQRLCIARALVRQPELLVLDEATNALDPAVESAVLTRLRALPLALVLVTHRPFHPEAGDRIVLRPNTSPVVD